LEGLSDFVSAGKQSLKLSRGQKKQPGTAAHSEEESREKE
jgi:hypothetical protein